MKPGQTYNPFMMFNSCANLPLNIMTCSALSPMARLLWARLSFYSGRDGFCYPSQETLAKEFDIGIRQVGRLISELIDGGFIKKEYQQRDKGKFKANRYYFVWEKTLDDQPRKTDADNKSQRTKIADGHKQPQPADKNVHDHKTKIADKKNHIKESKKESLPGKENIFKNDKPKCKDPVIEQWEKIFGMPLPIKLQSHDHVKSAAYMIYLKAQGKMGPVRNPVGYLASIQGTTPDNFSMPIPAHDASSKPWNTAPTPKPMTTLPISNTEQHLKEQALKQGDTLTEHEKQPFWVKAQDDFMVKRGRVSQTFMARQLFAWEFMDQASRDHEKHQME